MSAVEQVSNGIDWWLREEVRQSHDGRNGYLDDYVKTRRGFALPAADSKNMDAQKAAGHFKRYEMQLGTLNQDALRDDYLVGKFMLFSLMFVSGGFRGQCFFEAASQADYERLRFGDNDQPNGAAGISIYESVKRAFHNGLADSPDWDSYLNTQHEGNKIVYEATTEVHEWFRDNPDRTFGSIQQGELPVENALVRQEVGLGLALSHIAIAQALRDGNLERTPFMHP